MSFTIWDDSNNSPAQLVVSYVLHYEKKESRSLMIEPSYKMDMAMLMYDDDAWLHFISAHAIYFIFSLKKI